MRDFVERKRFVAWCGVLCAALLAGGAGKAPRTDQPMTTAQPSTHHPNRLIHEKSPYLLQHAYNPVDWYPWGEEAFAKARQEDRPIFLSIGYSTCHWCHVMERESFENPDIAALMNQSFVSIKVDREEHPDIDQVYMTAVTALTGRGGREGCRSGSRRRRTSSSAPPCRWRRGLGRCSSRARRRGRTPWPAPW